MKKITLALAFLSAFNPVHARADDMDAAREAAKKHFISSAEPKVKDAVWTSKTMFKIGMFDDGSSKNGYAEYTCYTLHDYGFKGKKIWVQVVDIVKLSRNGEWVKLGEARCE